MSWLVVRPGEPWYPHRRNLFIKASLTGHMTGREEAGTEDRCGFELQLEGIHEQHIYETRREEYLDRELYWDRAFEPVCCWRTVWQDYEDQGRCIWHADVDEKPVDKLLAARLDSPERLDGAILRGVDAVDRLSFSGCGLIGATFDGARLPETDFSDANLEGANFSDANLREAEFPNARIGGARFPDADLRKAEFPDADLAYAVFPDVDLWWTEFPHADLSEAKFPDADLRYAEFSGADLPGAEFSDATLVRVQFSDADLEGAAFSDATFHETELSNADLREADFSNSDLREAEFPDADLRRAEFIDADAIGANFQHANLQDTLLIRTDCREATFTSALLYQTVFADTRINSQTTFFAPETTFYDSITSRPACVYEENRLTADQLPANVDPLEAAKWVYRRLETLHEANAFSEAARGFHISKEEAERALSRGRDEVGQYLVRTFMWYSTKHGESVKRLLGWWGGVIILIGGLLPIVGGIKDSAGTRYAITSLSELGTVTGWSEVLLNLYFSVITFSTIGYGDLSPAGPGTRILVAFESVAGALLMALLIFVLGRRVAR